MLGHDKAASESVADNLLDRLGHRRRGFANGNQNNALDGGARECEARVPGAELAFRYFKMAPDRVVGVRRRKGRVKDRERIFAEPGRLPHEI